MIVNPLKISSETSPKKILDAIAALREQKGKEKETLVLIDKALGYGHSFLIDLFWEKALTYQHLYMSEKSKLEGKNLEKQTKALGEMEKVVKEAEFYIKKYHLNQWESRLFRFWGRFHDFQNKFKLSAKDYKKALKRVKLDPDYTFKRIPRWLELEGFLAYALIMSGEEEEGFSMSKKVYRKYDESIEGKLLKKKDYTTWAIWKSGIPIRTLDALLNKGYIFNKEELISWLIDAERVLTPPRGVKVWGDKNFQFRKDEIKTIRKRIRVN